MAKLFTDRCGLERLSEGKFFFGEDSPLTTESDLFIINVESAVLTQIQYEADGVKVYRIEASQVLSQDE